MGAASLKMKMSSKLKCEGVAGVALPAGDGAGNGGVELSTGGGGAGGSACSGALEAKASIKKV